MTPQQIELVKNSWIQVIPFADTAADLFYAKLFELDDSLRGLFPSDLSEQKKKLMATLGRVVASLDDLPAVLPAVAALGKKHVAYGAKPEHYATVGHALLATLGAGLGPAFTPEVKGAWIEAYGALSGVMIEASK